MKVFKIKPKDGGPWCVQEIEWIVELLKNSDVDETYEITPALMSEDEFNELPEFEGW